MGILAPILAFQVLFTIFVLLTEKYDRTLVVLISSAFTVFFIRVFEDTDLEIIYLEFINWHTIALIIGMTILVENLKVSNYFDYWSIKVVIWSKLDSTRLFVFLGLFTLILSAFLDNVSAIILLASLTIVLSERLELDPIPIILYQGFITGVGGLLTPVGSVPTIIINGEAEIAFFDFMLMMSGITFIVFITTTIYFGYRYKDKLRKDIPQEIRDAFLQIPPKSVLSSPTTLLKGNILLIVLFCGFVLAEPLHVGVDFIALGVGIASLILFNVKTKYVWQHVNWDMLFFFIGLFVVIGGLEHSGALDPVQSWFSTIIVEYPILAIMFLLIIGGIASAFLDSIPVALIFASMFSIIVSELGSDFSEVYWLSAVFATNVGGGLAPIGSVTVLMAIESLHEKGIIVTFYEYIKLIFPLFIILVVLGWVYFIALFYLI